MKVITCMSILLALTFVSCGKIKQKTKDVINYSGEKVGEGATEFVEGVADGVKTTIERSLTLSDELIEMGVETGKTYVSRGSKGKNNELTIYLIFNQDFEDTICFKAFDETGVEIGRARQPISGAAGTASYLDVNFDERAHLETQSVIEMELCR